MPTEYKGVTQFDSSFEKFGQSSFDLPLNPAATIPSHSHAGATVAATANYNNNYNYSNYNTNAGSTIPLPPLTFLSSPRRPNTEPPSRHSLSLSARLPTSAHTVPFASSSSSSGGSVRARTPLPAPIRALTARSIARRRFVKTAAFPMDDTPPTLDTFLFLDRHPSYAQQQQHDDEEEGDGDVAAYTYKTAMKTMTSNATNAAIAALTRHQPLAARPPNTLYAHSTTINKNMFDDLLPSPRVVVHNPVRHALYKSAMERKHRGTSRNVLGGFYTS